MNDDQHFMKLMQTYFKQEQQKKIEGFRRLNLYCKKGQILFVGSSLMEQFPIYEFIQDYDIPLVIYNRGIGGYTTTDLREHLDECVFALEPSSLFLNIGTNDLSDPNYKEADMIDRYRDILRCICGRLPQTKLYLLAYYPSNFAAAPNAYTATILQRRTNARIISANQVVQALAREFDATWLDLNQGLYDENGDLKAEYTVDGIHMYANGYKAILDVLLPELLKLKIKS